MVLTFSRKNFCAFYRHGMGTLNKGKSLFLECEEITILGIVGSIVEGKRERVGIRLIS
jgi:hypothetical protein